MAIPAVGMNRCVGMAFVTELFLAGVAFHAVQHQALRVLLAFHCQRLTLSVTEHFISPDVEQFHVFRTDFGRWEHTGFGILWQFKFRYRPGRAAVVPDGYRDEQDKYDQSRDYFTAIIHRSSSLPAGLLNQGPEPFGQVLSLFTFDYQCVADKLA